MKMPVGSFVLVLLAALVQGAHAQTSRSQMENALASELGRTVTVDRTVLIPGCVGCGDADIVQYSMVIEVGPGEFDRFRLHRVVKEARTGGGGPVRTGVMLVHGDTSSFQNAFALSPKSEHQVDEHSLAVFLAINDVDVWGFDMRWTLVPASTTQFDFMADWNMDTHLDDLQLAIRLMRFLRARTGYGGGKVFLGGWSRGAQLTYGFANRQAQRPGRSRDLKGIIPMDFAYVIDPTDAALVARACQRLDAVLAAKAAGIHVNDLGAQANAVAFLAQLFPDAPTPIPEFAGLTNEQVALVFLGATYLVAPPATPHFHWNAPVVDPATLLPVDLQFASLDYMLDFGLLVPPFQSNGEQLDGVELQCGRTDSVHDDFLHRFREPALYIGAEGGIGSAGGYTLSLLGGPVTVQSVSFIPPVVPLGEFLDYGHTDILTADNADMFVWEPILAWLRMN